MELRWLLTAGFEILTENFKMLIDPFISRPPNATPQLNAKISDIRDAHAIFLTHGHYDHSIDVPEIVRNTEIKVYCSRQIARVFVKNLGVDEKHIIKIKPSQVIELKPDLRVTTIKSQHIQFDDFTLKRLESSRSAKIEVIPGVYFGDVAKYVMGDVFGFLFEFSNGKKVVHFGSGGYYDEELTKLPKDIDIFLAPVAGREDVEKVIAKMADIIKPKMIIPHHYDDFVPPFSLYSYSNLHEEVKKLDPEIIVKKIEHETYFEF